MMERWLSRHGGAFYSIQLQGVLDQSWADNFGNLEFLTFHSSDGQRPPVTTVVGEVVDQAALAGIGLRQGLGIAQRRRKEAIRAPGRKLRRLCVLHGPGNRPFDRLPRRIRPARHTIIFVTSDNGSSAEGGPNGSFNENKFFNNVEDTVEANLAMLDEWGGVNSYPHYSSGWAWAFDTPFPYWKRYAGFEGGVCDMMVIAWPPQLEAGGVRHQYLHAIDVVPTVYDMLGVEPPQYIKGYKQSPIEGESFAATFSDSDAPERQTQFYSMLGMRSIYHEGWLATALHPALSGWANFDKDEWELYNLREDRSQSNNLAGDYPEKLQELVGLWFYNAGLYNGMPVDDRTAAEQLNRERPEPGKPRSQYIYYPVAAEVPESVAVSIPGRNYTIAAHVSIESDLAEGVIFAHGGAGGGHALYVKNGELVYLYNWLGEKYQYVRGGEITPGNHAYTAEFTITGQDDVTKSAIGMLKLYMDKEVVGESEIWTQPASFALAGDGLNVGMDRGSPTSAEYLPPFEFEGGEIKKVIVDVSGTPYVDYEKQVHAWLALDYAKALITNYHATFDLYVLTTNSK